MAKRGSWIVMFCVLFASATALAQIDARMFRFPDVSATHIAFVYAGDIWVVDRAGGTAKRLSSPAGEESFPRFSPDGSKIAFSGNYDGNTDVYVIPALGGEPVRVTWHPETDRLIDWTPDGDALLFASPRASGTRRYNQLYRISPQGGLAEKLPIAYGESGALSQDGRYLAFTPKSRDFRTWKRYRGGMAPDIWVFDMKTAEARNITRSDANESMPMWHGKTIYFLSDRGPEQRSNIWACNPDGSRMRQVTKFKDFDITFPAVGPSDIVFQAGGRLYLLDLKSEKSREVKIDVVTDLSSLRPRPVNVSRMIRGAAVSPTGKRAVFEARGDVFTLPAEHGVIRRLTDGSAAAERYPAWSPDGKYIAYWSDRSGEYELVLRNADASGGEQTLTRLGAGYRYRPFWSPDSKKIAFIDHTQAIRILEVESRTLARVDKCLWLIHPALAAFEVAWSSDSRWLAYSRGLETNNNAIFLFDGTTGTAHQVTSGYYSDNSPAFDPEGEYLYYLSNRSFSPIYSDLDATWIYPNTTRILAVPLRKDVASPLAPRNDEEKAAEEIEKKPEAEKGEKPEAAAAAEPKAEEKASGREKEGAKPKEVPIDLEGFESRAVVLPPEAGNYGTLRAAPGKVVYQRMPRTGASDRNRPILFFDLKERKEETILENAGAFDLSADGKKMLVKDQNNWSIIDVAPKQKMDKKLATADIETVVDPRSEWKQIFNDVWRTYRDYFYDPDLHGLDWNALRAHYGGLITDSVTRWDVNFVLGELIGEVNASHTYVGGGDLETPQRRRTGLLGVDWALENGAYRIAHIVRGAPWDIETRSPLNEPGLGVREGEYVLAVNGVPVDVTREPYAALEGLAGVTVSLTVNDQPALEGARQVLVKTLSSESRMRNLEWIERNRKRVEEASGGRVGYVFVPDTSLSGQSELVRQFNSQMRKDGLIIDERFNAGGQLPDRFIELMNRPLVNRIALRNGDVMTQPAVTHYGPKVMLINGWAGSGGDAFPYFFKELKVGPLIGERTWGGLIGPAVGHSTIDGGSFTAPPGRIYGADGKWFAEGHGVDPDIAVVDDPGELARGRDPQLEAAIAEVMRLVKENPPHLPDPPAFEKRIVNPRP